MKKKIIYFAQREDLDIPIPAVDLVFWGDLLQEMVTKFARSNCGGET